MTDNDATASDGQALTPEQLGKIRRSLDKPGFLLEHRTFETLQSHGLNAFLGHDYKDGGTGREIDDVVTRDHLDNEAGVAAWASVVVECKNWNAPVVVIGRDKSRAWRARSFGEAAFSGDPLADESLNRKDDFFSSVVFLKLRTLPASVESSGFFGNQIVLLERKGADYAAGNSGIYESALLAIGKATFSEQEALLDGPQSTWANPGDTTRPSVVLSFPLLVTSQPVVEAEPDGRDVHMRQVPWSRVVRRFGGKGLINDSLVIEVVQEGALADWVTTRYLPFCEQAVAQLNRSAAIYRRAAVGDHVSTVELTEIAGKLG